MSVNFNIITAQRQYYVLGKGLRSILADFQVKTQGNTVAIKL